MASTSAAAGATCNATMVASGGPRMKTASSTSDSQAKAVRSNDVPCSWADQRARISGPMFGCAAPATSASRKIGQFRSVVSAMTIIPAIAGTCTASWMGSTLLCPKTSICREICGPISAADSA